MNGLRLARIADSLAIECVGRRMVSAGVLPVRACVYDMSNELDGAVTPSVVKKMKESCERVCKLIADSGSDPTGFFVKGIRDALKLSVSKYSASYMNELFSVYGSIKDEKVSKFIKDEEEALDRYCRGNEVFSEVVSMMTSALASKGISHKGSKTLFGGEPCLHFAFLSSHWFVPMQRSQFYRLFARSGSKRTEVYMSDSPDDSMEYDTFTVRGGIDSLVKTIKSKSV